jgi:hypothetical protein
VITHVILVLNWDISVHDRKCVRVGEGTVPLAIVIYIDGSFSVKPGCVGDVRDAEKRIRHKLLPRNAWMLVPYFELFMSCPKDELHQWYLRISLFCFKISQ